MYTSVGSGISGSAYTAVTQLYSWTQPIKKQPQHKLGVAQCSARMVPTTPRALKKLTWASCQEEGTAGTAGQRADCDFFPSARHRSRMGCSAGVRVHHLMSSHLLHHRRRAEDPTSCSWPEHRAAVAGRGGGGAPCRLPSTAYASRR